MAIDGDKFAAYANRQTDVAINRYEKRFYRHLNSLGDDIAAYLSGVKRIDNLSKPAIDSIIAQVVSVQNNRYRDAVEDFISDAALLAEYSAQSEVLALGMPKQASQVYKKVSKTPIAASGLFIDEHMDNLVAYNNERIAKAIRFGWSNKVDVNELSAVLIGTEKARYADGLIHKQKQSARAAIDTACHHCSQVARAEARAANDVYKYRIVATLDNRVTEICRELDGKVYEYGSQSSRVPPFHYFCRTVIIPEIDKEYSWLSEGRTRSSMYGSVSSQTTYAEWAKQNADKIAEQNEIDRQKRNRRARARRKANQTS